MLIIGYSYGIRSGRRLCEEVHLNLAYRWFCRLPSGLNPFNRTPLRSSKQASSRTPQNRRHFTLEQIPR